MKLVILGPNNYLSMRVVDSNKQLLMRSYLFSGRTRLLSRIHPSIQSLIAFEQREQFRTVQNRSEQFRKDQDSPGQIRTDEDRPGQTIKSINQDGEERTKRRNITLVGFG